MVDGVRRLTFSDFKSAVHVDTKLAKHLYNRLNHRVINFLIGCSGKNSDELHRELKLQLSRLAQSKEFKCLQAKSTRTHLYIRCQQYWHALTKRWAKSLR